MNVIASGRQIDQVVNYQVPVRKREELGKMPSDIFLSTDQTPALETLRHDCTVSYDQPQVAEGKPVMEARSEHFQENAQSPILAGLVGGFVGGVTGFIAGGFLSMVTGNGAFLVAVAPLGLAGGATLGAVAASHDRVRLVEEEFNIEQRRMTGVEVDVQPGELNGKTGYFHRFEPNFESTPLGHYTQPRVEHYSA